jgi:transposase
MVLPCAIDGESFATYVEEVLAPELRHGDILVMDNLPVHKSERVTRAVEAAGCMLVYLPPYSPDYNPIEMAISKVKSVLRSLARRSVDGLFDGIGEALGSIRPTDALHYIAHCGYATKTCKPL